MHAARGWADVPVVVTGASGFIGSHLVRRLTDLGARVHMVSRHPRFAADGCDWHAADLTDVDKCVELIGDLAPDVVFHLSSAATGARDVDLVVPLMAANQVAAVNLLTAIAKSAPTARVVFAGSLEEPHHGEDPTPRSPYAAAKWAATGYARMFYSLWNMRVSVLRISMAYGPDQPDVTKLVPYATLALLRGSQPQLSSGARWVDWVYVDDVVDSLVRTAETEATIGQVFDICSGQPVSIRDTMELLTMIIGSDGRPHFGAVADRPLDQQRRGDPRPAAELMDWRATTPLEEGLRKTVDWYAQKVLRG